jgi:uncharacterized protein (DUF58 family)
MARRRWSFLMPPLEHGFIRRLEDAYRGRLTPLGRALLWGLIAAGMLRLGTLSTALYVTVAVFVALLAAAFLAGLPQRPSLVLTRRLPPSPSAGDTWRYTVRVENRSARLWRDVTIEERDLPPQLRPSGPPPVIAELAPGESIEVRLSLRCLRRGAYTLERLQAASSFPAGLVKLGAVQRITDRLLVCPAFERLEDFQVPVSSVHQPGGIPVASKVGESMEFAGLRDWRPGDRPRDVYWPAYARTNRLVVREHLQEHFARLALVLDIEAPRPRDEVHFERGLSVAAAIADALARKEYIIDIFAAGDDVHHFQAGRALAHFENILELMACVEPGQTLDTGALSAAIMPQAARLSAVVFVLTTWDDERAAVVDAMRALGIAVRVLCVRPDVEITGLPPQDVVRLR